MAAHLMHKVCDRSAVLFFDFIDGVLTVSRPSGESQSHRHTVTVNTLAGFISLQTSQSGVPEMSEESESAPKTPAKSCFSHTTVLQVAATL